MKRSDMITVIEKAINRVYDLCPAETEMLAMDILHDIEHAGMLPPGYRQTHTFNRYIITEFKIGYWEPEADKPLNGGLVADIKADEADKAKE